MDSNSDDGGTASNYDNYPDNPQNYFQDKNDQSPSLVYNHFQASDDIGGTDSQQQYATNNVNNYNDDDIGGGSSDYNNNKSNSRNINNKTTGLMEQSQDAAQNYFQKSYLEQEQQQQQDQSYNNMVMMDIDLTHNNDNYYDDDGDQNNDNVNNNIFESKKDLHKISIKNNNNNNSRSRAANNNNNQLNYIDASKDEAVNQRVEKVLDTFNDIAGSNNDDTAGGKQLDTQGTITSNSNNKKTINKVYKRKNQNNNNNNTDIMAMTLDQNNNRSPNMGGDIEQVASSTIQPNDYYGGNNGNGLYESQDIKNKNNNFIMSQQISDQEDAAQLYGVDNNATNGAAATAAKLKVNNNIDMKMFNKKDKKPLKKSFKGVNMQNTDDQLKIVQQNNGNGSGGNGMEDTYQPPKKGKNKKDRGQEIVIDDDDNNDDGDGDGDGDDNTNTNQDDDNTANNGGGGGNNIEFYNRSPRVGYETNDEDRNNNNNQYVDNNNDNDDNDGGNNSDYIDLKDPLKQISVVKQGGKQTLNKNKILKNKANKDYLEQLKTNKSYLGSNNKNQTMDNAYDEPDDYTKEYLRQKKQKSSRRDGAGGGGTLTGTLNSTLNHHQYDPNNATQQYGLQNVSVAQVMETTRKTQRGASQRSNRNHLEFTMQKQNNNLGDTMNKTIGGGDNKSPSLMGTIQGNKFSIAEVEYKDRQPDEGDDYDDNVEFKNRTINMKNNSQNLGNTQNGIDKKKEIGGALAGHEIREVEYKNRQNRKGKRQHDDIGDGDSSSDDEQSDQNRYKAMTHLQLPQVQTNKNNSGDQQQFDNQVNNSYLVTNEHQRILESHEDIRMSEMINEYPPRNNQNEFEDVNLNRPLDKKSNQHSKSNSRKQSNQSLQNSQKINKEGSQKFNQLNYDLSRAINEARENDENNNSLSQQLYNSTIVPFRAEQFKTLILNTYDDWYSDISIRWDINDYLEVVDKSQLEQHFSKYLEQNGLNLLTLVNMPFVDLGNRPASYNPRKPEAEQIYVIPSSNYPNKLVIKYADCKPVFGMKMIDDKYKKTTLEEHGVTIEDLKNCILNASIYLRPYRGAVTRLDRINLINILVGLAVTIALSMSIGITMHWAFSLIFIVIYFIFAAISIRLTKKKSNKYLRQAHFMLALYCRAENNRFFMKKNVEVRPGFLARWIEFNIYNTHKQQQQNQNDDQTRQGINENQGVDDLENLQGLSEQQKQQLQLQKELEQDLTSPDYLEKMRDRWEKQKNMKKINLFNDSKGKKNPPIPIKDIDQYKADQQLAMLLQEQESEKYGDQQFYEQEEFKDNSVNHDFESVNAYNSNAKFNHQGKNNLRHILPPINQMGGVPPLPLNEEQIYSGLYDQQQQHQIPNQKMRIPHIKTRGGNQKQQQQQFYSPDNNTSKFQTMNADDYYEDGQSVQSSMKKLTRSYYNMAAVPQNVINGNARKGSNMINPMLMHKQSDEHHQQIHQDYEEEIKEQDDYDDDDHYSASQQPQQMQQQIRQDFDDNDDEYDDEEEYKQQINQNNNGGIYSSNSLNPQSNNNNKQYTNKPQTQYNHNHHQVRESVQSNKNFIDNNAIMSGQKLQLPAPKQNKKYQEDNSYHQDDSISDDDDY